VATLGSWSVRGYGSGRRAGGSTRTIVAAAGNGKAVKFSQAQLASSGNVAAETDDVEVEVTYLRDITLKAIKTFGYNDKDAAVLEDVRPIPRQGVRQAVRSGRTLRTLLKCGV
jgi:hypothetical protein